MDLTLGLGVEQVDTDAGPSQAGLQQREELGALDGTVENTDTGQVCELTEQQEHVQHVQAEHNEADSDKTTGWIFLRVRTPT